MLALEEEEELSAANHWLLPAGDYTGHAPFNANHIPLMESFTQKTELCDYLLVPNLHAVILSVI